MRSRCTVKGTLTWLWNPAAAMTWGTGFARTPGGSAIGFTTSGAAGVSATKSGVGGLAVAAGNIGDIFSHIPASRAGCSTVRRGMRNAGLAKDMAFLGQETGAG